MTFQETAGSTISMVESACEAMATCLRGSPDPADPGVGSPDVIVSNHQMLDDRYPGNARSPMSSATLSVGSG